MKKILCISLAVFLMIALSACVKSQDPAPSPSVEPDTTVSADVPDAAPSGDAQSQVSSDGADSLPSSDSIIAESSNTVSDKEIGAILDDLSGELNSALDGTKNLEDLDDSDLDVNNIE
jgi:hypothetical protein